MSDDTENKEIILKSVESERVVIESKIEKAISEPKVPETMPEIAPEVPSETPESIGEIPTEPVETQTAQMGGNEPLEEKARETVKEDTREEQPKKTSRKRRTATKRETWTTPPNGTNNYLAPYPKEARQSHGTVCEANRDNKRRSREAFARLRRHSDTIPSRA